MDSSPVNPAIENPSQVQSPPMGDEMVIDSEFSKAPLNGLETKTLNLPSKPAEIDVAMSSLPSPPANGTFVNGNGNTAPSVGTAEPRDIASTSVENNAPSNGLPSTTSTSIPTPAPASQDIVMEESNADNMTPVNEATITEAPESDLREVSKPAEAAQIAEIKDHKVENDVQADRLQMQEAMDVATPSELTADTKPASVPSVPTVKAADSGSLSPMTATNATAPSASACTNDISHDVSQTVVESPDTIAPTSENLTSQAAPASQASKSPSNVDIATGTSQTTTTSGAASASLPASNSEPVKVETPLPSTTAHTIPLNDIEMAGQSKPVRDRDDDSYDDEPLAKRAKTNSITDSDGFKVPDAPVASVSPAASGPGNSASEPPLSEFRKKQFVKCLQTLKRSTNANPFKAPVDPVALNIPNYPLVVTKPMDLGTMESNLKANLYDTTKTFVDDFNQIVENTRLFNGEAHNVTQMAVKLKGTFDKFMANIPSEDAVEMQKKAVPKTATARREPRAIPKPAAPTSTAPVFALNPEGVPLIRRDSTVQDGRPKREIHPPKNRDMPYSMKPKKKKFQLELRFCREALDELYKQKYSPQALPFLKAVDPVALNIPNYHSIIKKPMDMGTIDTKLKGGEYENAKDFEADIRLMFKNCYKFNRPTDYVFNCGKELEAAFDAKWNTKTRWLDAHEPPSQPAESDEEESEEESAAESEEEPEEDASVALLQKQIAEMSKKLTEMEKKKAAKKAKKASPQPKKAKAGAAKKEKNGGGRGKKDKKGKSGKGGVRYVTFAEKQFISSSLELLPSKKQMEVFEMIKKALPHLVSDEAELDIEVVPNETLAKVLEIVKKYVPNAPEEEDPQLDVPVPAPTKTKKHKPMSKTEQENRIRQMQQTISQFKGEDSDDEGGAMQSIENRDSSSDDDDSEESEEE